MAGWPSQEPYNIAIDGNDDLWVNSDFQTVVIYAADGSPIGNLPTGAPIDTLAVRGRFMVVSVSIPNGPFAFAQLLSSEVIAQLPNYEQDYSSSTAVNAIAFLDPAHYLAAQANGEIDLVNTETSTMTPVFEVAYGPSAMVVDAARQRIYVASDTQNKIDVYDMAWHFLKMIQ